MAFKKSLNGAFIVSGVAASTVGRIRGGVRWNAPALLWNSLLRKVVLWTAGGSLFLSLIMSLAELFSILWRFLAHNAPFLRILAWIGLGAPKHIAESLPVAFLFAIVFILSDWHANRELEAVFSAGISLQRLLLPVVAFSLFLCVFELVLTEYMSIPFLRARDTLQASSLQDSTTKNSIPGLIVEKGKYIYTFRYYDMKNQRLYNPSIIERNAQGDLVRRISAQNAHWDHGIWRFMDASIYTNEGALWKFVKTAEFTDPQLNESPSSFERPTMDVRLLSIQELSAQIQFLNSSGLPSTDAEVERQRRFSFSLTPLIVIGLAGAFIGRFKKSIFLLSMLSSLSSATFYYVAQMVASLAAKSRILSPTLAIWSVMCCFALISVVSYLSART